MEERRVSETYTHDDIVRMLSIGEQKTEDTRKLMVWLVGASITVAGLIAGVLFTTAIELSANRAADIALSEQHYRFEQQSNVAREKYANTFNDLVKSVGIITDKVYEAEKSAKEEAEKRIDKHEGTYKHSRN